MNIKKTIKDIIKNSRYTFNLFESVFDLIKSAPSKDQTKLFLSCINALEDDRFFKESELLYACVSSCQYEDARTDSTFERIYDDFQNEIDKYECLDNYDDFYTKVWDEINKPIYTYLQSRRIFSTYIMESFGWVDVDPDNNLFESTYTYDLRHYKPREGTEKQTGAKNIVYIVRILGAEEALCNLSFEISSIVGIPIDELVKRLNKEESIRISGYYRLQIIKQLARKYSIVVIATPYINYTRNYKNLNLFMCSNCNMYIPEDSKYCIFCSMPIGRSKHKKIYYVSPITVCDNVAFCPACGTANPINAEYCKECSEKLITSLSISYPHEKFDIADDDTGMPF